MLGGGALSAERSRADGRRSCPWSRPRPRRSAARRSARGRGAGSSSYRTVLGFGWSAVGDHPRAVRWWRDSRRARAPRRVLTSGGASAGLAGGVEGAASPDGSSSVLGGARVPAIAGRAARASTTPRASRWRRSSSARSPRDRARCATGRRRLRQSSSRSSKRTLLALLAFRGTRAGGDVNRRSSEQRQQARGRRGRQQQSLRRHEHDASRAMPAADVLALATTTIALATRSSSPRSAS